MEGTAPHRTAVSYYTYSLSLQYTHSFSLYKFKLVLREYCTPYGISIFCLVYTILIPVVVGYKYRY